MLLKSAPISTCPGAAQIIDAAAVANDGKRPRIELRTCCIIAGGNGSDRRIEILDGRALQVLRLETFAGPAAGGCAVIAKGTANTIVIAGTGEQRIDLLDCCLSAAEAQLQRPLHLWRQISGSSSSFSIAFLSSFFNRAALLLQPLQQPRDLVDTGDGAASDLGELRIDLRCCGLCDPACSFGKFPIDTEAALVDPGSSAPTALLRGRQRRQPLVELALDLHVLPAIAVKPIEPFRVIKPVCACGILVLMCAAAASTSDASAARRRHPCGWQARAHPPRRSAVPAIRAPSDIAMVQRWRSSGISGQPKRGARTCCSIAVSK